ncbi:hypothetical protein CcaverHIS002_0312220 [Cutaneotrichosporon cavernicola]|nr:hypothetical protein CcaverHIS002_0312220 [Cutaneotrichosporon cavernicola]
MKSSLNKSPSDQNPILTESELPSPSPSTPTFPGPSRRAIDTIVMEHASSLMPLDEGPPKRAGRNIVVLLDGTGQGFCDTNSNIIKLHTVLKADEEQFLYYSSGLGTVLPASTGSWANARREMAMIIDKAVAWNFDDCVCDAYAYLMDYYTPGDRVYIFGFSRGAYVARALAGMIQKVGLLPRGNQRSLKAAYRVYTDPKAVRSERADDSANQPGAQYRRIFSLSRPVVIEFLGAWDTVSSLGGFRLPRLPFASGVKTVKFLRQALALDERRIRFTPEYIHYDVEENALWERVRVCKTHLAQLSSRYASRQDPGMEHAQMERAQMERAQKDLAHARAELNNKFPIYEKTKLGMLKRRRMDCWFMGCHSDVGGGNDLNGDPSLSNIPLRWIVREAVDCGLLLSATGMSYLAAMAIPEWARKGYPNENHCGPSAATIDFLSCLAAIVDETLTSPCTEQEALNDMDKLCQQIKQEELRKLVDLVAWRDVGPDLLSLDATRPCKESLRGFVYRSLEVCPLKTRWYAPDMGTVETKSRVTVNFGAPRRMMPGQRVHMSVYHRMNAPEQLGLPKYRPRARLPSEFKDWDDALRKKEDPLWLM